MLLEFELDNKAVEATKKIYCTKVKSKVDHRSGIKWFKKFHWHFDDQARSVRVNTENSRAVLKAIAANLANNTQRVSE